MSRSSFQAQVSRIVSQLSQEQLADFVTVYSRYIMRDEEKDFLRLLEQSRKKYVAELSPVAGSSPEALRTQVEQANHNLDQIESGALSLEGILEEDGYEYLPDDPDVTFSIPSDLAHVLEEIALLLSHLSKAGLFQEAAALTERLLMLEFPVEYEEEEYSDYYDDPRLSELHEEGLLSPLILSGVRDGLYATYRLEPAEEAAARLRPLLCEQWVSVTVKDLLNGREENPDHERRFLSSWAEVLSSEIGNRAETLLIEAVSRLAQGQELHALVQRFAHAHPTLYIWLLTPGNWSTDPEELLAAGEQAISELETNPEVRAEAELLSADEAMKLGETERAELLWLEALRAQPTPVNLLRLMTECRDYSVYRQQVRQIVEQLKAKHRPFRDDLAYRYLNSSGLKNEMALVFLIGDYDDFLQRGLSCDEWLGWSITPMKLCINLTIFALASGEKTPALAAVGEELRQRLGFRRLDYECGLNRNTEEPSMELLSLCLQRWRELFPISDAQREQMMERLDHLLAKRTEAILRGGRRNYYGECARWILAMGELLEAQGEPNAKERLRTIYLLRYPRHSAFRREMKGF